MKAYQRRNFDKFFKSDLDIDQPSTFWGKVFKRWAIPSRAGTTKHWKRWEMIARKRFPVRYFLQETLVHWINVNQRRYFHDPIWWVRYRTINRNHVIKVESMTPGYYEPADIIFHMAFDQLRRFIEEGLAYRNVEFNEGRRPKWLPKFVNFPIDKIASGMDHLDWYINHGELGTEDVDRFKAIKMLYIWWKFERDKRIEPWSDERIWGTPDEAKETKVRWKSSLFHNMRQKYGDKSREMASATSDYQEKEDQLMLEKLISLRQCLWT